MDKFKEDYLKIQWDLVILSIKLSNLDKKFKDLQEISKSLYEKLQKEEGVENGESVQ